MRKKHFITVVSSLLALCFTAYIALDTFIIPHSYASSVSSAAAASAGSAASETSSGAASDSASTDETEGGSSANATVTDLSYLDDNMAIVITQYREEDTDIYVADITLSSAEYLKTALAKATYGKNITETTSEQAADNNAILAINGDYYGVQESGYVIRQGTLYRSTARSNQEDLVIYRDGSMEIVNEDEITAEELLNQGAWNVLSFGPGLLKEGEIQVSTTDEVDKAMTSNPRTAIGMIDDLHYVFVVADGRSDESEGLSLYQLARFMQTLGVQTAYNLDGGGSSTMVLNGTVINTPSGSSGGGRHGSSSSDGERSVSDIVYIGY